LFVNSAELKKVLVQKGFQVFRTIGTQVILAERVRDNLVMDSGVSVVCGKRLTLRVTVKAQASDFPRESEPELLSRARTLIGGIGTVGFDEVETAVVPIHDPGSPERQIDTCYEVTFERVGVDEADLEEALKGLLKAQRTA
jgi:hypothetical protein